ncbi:MAG TPA: DUF1643 domain-containing protein [Acidimicrobiia bacterium]
MPTGYRYWLTRVWDVGQPPVSWVMLNPSTATETVDDPTIRRVVAFSRLWGFGSALVVNLFALRSVSPETLARHPDPVGPENDSAIERAIGSADLVVVAWGNHGLKLNPKTRTPRSSEVAALLSGVNPRCLGLTASGQPRHPLYLPSCTASMAFPRPT